MNKNDLISKVADSAGLTKVDAGAAVEAVFSTIETAMAQGDSVSIIGFGTFSITKRAARTGRNPRTGESIKIKASNQPKFKAGTTLKQAVNK